MKITTAPEIPCDNCTHCNNDFLPICEKGYSIGHFMNADVGEEMCCNKYYKRRRLKVKK